MKDLVYFLLGLLIIVCIAVGSFLLYRWVNWEFAYKTYVKSMVTEMVKPECLNEKK